MQFSHIALLRQSERLRYHAVMQEPAVSQKQIADYLNLSTATVSRSLRNDSAINPATRARVIEAATKLGYELRASARSRRAFTERQETTSLAVFIGHPSGFQGDPSPAGEHVLAGLSDAAAQKNTILVTHFVPPEEAYRLLASDGQPAAMRAGQLSGLILLYPFPEEVVAALSQQLPCVSIVHHHPALNVDCIDTDQTGSVARLVEHLVALGHRRIGFLSWGHGLSWERRRFHGYVQGLMDADLAYDPALVINLNGTPLGQEHEARRIADLRAEGVGAWVCAADHVGYHLCRHLQQMGLALGRDVSVAGYDGMQPPPDCPALTTIRVPFREMGFAAIRRLLYRIEEPAARLRDIILRSAFVVGETTGPAA